MTTDLLCRAASDLFAAVQAHRHHQQRLRRRIITCDGVLRQQLRLNRQLAVAELRSWQGASRRLRMRINQTLDDSVQRSHKVAN